MLRPNGYGAPAAGRTKGKFVAFEVFAIKLIPPRLDAGTFALIGLFGHA
jgi:hypothetical protein